MTDTVSNIPAPSAPMLLPTGQLSPAWWQFFVTLYTRTGNAQGVDIEAIKATIEALVTQNAALTKQLSDLVAELGDYKSKYVPAGYIHATASGVKRRIAYYNEDK